MGGRKPIPTPLKLVTGKKGRGINEDEPEFLADVPECPLWLKSDSAKAEWVRVTKLLSDAGVITVADGNSVAMYCHIVGEIEKLTAVIEEHGYVSYDIKINQDTGEEIMINPKTNPHSLRLENYIKELRSYSALLGLDPLNRSKIKVTGRQTLPTQGKNRFFK